MESTEQQSQTWVSAWQMELVLTGCEVCDWIFVLSPRHLPLRCPHCAQQELTTLDETADKPIYTQPPELTLPYHVDASEARSALTKFARTTLAPSDLNAKNLHGRLRPIYLPMWLVDAEVQAKWQAEMGFDYEVVSHKEDYRNGRWHTREVKETRIRWEPRLGTLQREYHNRQAPALEEQDVIERHLGKAILNKTQQYTPATIQNALVRLPNRPPDDAWPEAEFAFKQAAGEECMQAASAQHIRQYKWQPSFNGQHWTQLLYPIYTSFYRDDDNNYQILYINGQTGALVGIRKASMKRAKRYSLILGGLAGVMFFASLAAFLLGFLLTESLFGLAGMILVAGMVTAVIAFVPVLYAWSVNSTAKTKPEAELQTTFLK